MLHITAFNAAGDHLPPVQFKRWGNIINITLADTAESQLAGARRHRTIQSGQQGDTAVRCMGLRGKCHSGIVNTMPRPARRAFDSYYWHASNTDYDPSMACEAVCNQLCSWMDRKSVV